MNTGHSHSLIQDSLQTSFHLFYDEASLDEKPFIFVTGKEIYFLDKKGIELREDSSIEMSSSSRPTKLVFAPSTLETNET